MPNLISFMLYLEQFYRIPKNSRTIMYAKIFWFLRNYSIYQPKTNHIIRALRASLLSISLNAILVWYLRFFKNCFIYKVYRYEQ